jgi:uncharacterized protein YcaQ
MTRRRPDTLSLADEIRLMARWLGLPRVKVSRTGDAAATLRRML